MNYQKITDNDIWKRFKSGDDAALSYIYKKQYKLLFAYGMKIIPNQELIKDAIQDVFVKLYLHRKNLSDTININAYLIRTLKNKLFDQLSSKYEFLSIDSIPFNFKLEEPFLEKYAKEDSDLKKIKMLLTAINSLTPSQKEIIYLRFIRNLSYDEIGEILNIKYQSAKNLTTRALAKLREVYFGL